MLDSQKPNGLWEVEEDIAYRDLPIRRRPSANLPQDRGGPSEDAFHAERDHLRSFGVTDRERISTFLGMKLDAYEQRIHRAAS